MGHWIRDAVVLRWAEMTAQLSAGELEPGRVLSRLLSGPDPSRMDSGIRELYDSARNDLQCVWTGRALGVDFEVDHAIPFTFWRASPSWNLFPATRSVNNAKRDKLPSAGLVRRQQERIVQCWSLINRTYPSRFRREAALLIGHDPGRRWENELFSSFVEAVEYTGNVRGAERWEPGALAGRSG